VEIPGDMMWREGFAAKAVSPAGDIEACLKLGEIYLRGSAAIAKNIHIGIYYLRLAIPKDHGRIASCFAKNLSLREIVDEDLIIFLKELLR
jgi:TPR repeat protein